MFEADGESSISFTSKNRIERAMKIYELLEQFSLRSSKDIIATLHYRLKDLLPGYQFIDLINAIVHFRKKVLDGKKLIKTNQKAFIQHNNEYYVYRIVILQEIS